MLEVSLNENIRARPESTLDYLGRRDTPGPGNGDCGPAEIMHLGNTCRICFPNELTYSESDLTSI